MATTWTRFGCTTFYSMVDVLTLWSPIRSNAIWPGLAVSSAPREAFGFDGLLRDLVPTWQTASPIRALEGEGWHEPGAFYVHVGTEDSLGSSLPPGAMALVEPISNDERLQPSPRRIYLLQFGNGYRCSHCVATGGKLRLFSTGKAYLGQEAFSYPGSVRIAGGFGCSQQSFLFWSIPLYVCHSLADNVRT